MSFIAKYYLVKMFPKKRALTIDGDALKVTMINVIGEMIANEPPKDKATLMQSFELKINGEVVIGPDSPEDRWDKVKVEWGGETYTPDDYMKIKDEVIPVGDEIVFHFPNIGLQAGDKAKMEVHVIQDRPIKFKIMRSVV